MNQIYNLAQTIADDKETIATVDTKASVGVYGDRERITDDNFATMNIKQGDKVAIVVSGDDDFESGTIVDVWGLDYSTTSTFLYLTPHRNGGLCWYDYNSYGYSNPIDELYLIRTPEGSLNK